MQLQQKNWRFAVKGEYNYTLNPLINLVKEIVMKTLAPTPPTEFKEILRRLSDRNHLQHQRWRENGNIRTQNHQGPSYKRSELRDVHPVHNHRRGLQHPIIKHYLQQRREAGEEALNDSFTHEWTTSRSDQP